MKTLLHTVILTVILFTIVAAITVFLPKPATGTEEYGFPFRFYTYGQVETASGVLHYNGIVVSALVYEVLSIAALAFILVLLKNKLNNPSTKTA